MWPHITFDNNKLTIHNPVENFIKPIQITEHDVTFMDIHDLENFFAYLSYMNLVNIDENIAEFNNADAFDRMKEEVLPKELLDLISYNDSKHTLSIPLIYIPLFIDYNKELFPLYYPPTNEEILIKVNQYINSMGYDPTYGSNGIFVRYQNLDQKHEIYDLLTKFFEEKEIVENGLGFVTTNVTKYQQLWDQYYQELFNTDTVYNELESIIKNNYLIEMVKDYLYDTLSAYHRVFVKPVQRRREITNQLNRYLVPDLSRITMEYENPAQELRPPF